jgi:ribonuclease BN (tRNA processing enzyme)
MLLHHAKLEVLGTEGAFSDNNTSYLIDDHILIDTSETIAKKLFKQDRLKNINMIFFTHQYG